MGRSDQPTPEIVDAESTRLLVLSRDAFRLPNAPKLAEWEAEIRATPDEVLIRLLERAAIDSTYQPITNSLRATLDARLSRREIDAMEKLDRSAQFLAKVAIGVGLLQVFLQLAG